MLNVTGTIFLAVSGIFFTNWIEMFDCATGSIATSDDFERCTAITGITALYDNFKSPYPWIFIASVVVLITGFKGVKTSVDLESSMERNRSYKRDIDEYSDLLDQERNNHAETKSAYLSDIERTTHTSLPLDRLGFDANCRVSIYRKISGDDSLLRQSYRHAIKPAFNQPGKIKIASNQGIVGLVWNHESCVCFNCDAAANSRRKHNRELAAFFARHGVTDIKGISGHTRMPSKSILAIRLGATNDPNNRSAILVFESTAKNQFNEHDHCAILEQNRVELERIASVITFLDGELRPDAG